MSPQELAEALAFEQSTALTLHEKQALFVRLVPWLIAYAFAHGYAVTFGEVLRTQLQAQADATSGAGIAHSNHLLRIAADFMLFRDGVYLTETKDYEPLGRYWESLHPLCRWGGRFAKPDGDHFSLYHQGVA